MLIVLSHIGFLFERPWVFLAGVNRPFLFNLLSLFQLQNFRTFTIVFVQCIFYASNLDAQPKVVTALGTDTATPSILIKWYSRQLVYDEGVHIYRKESSEINWTRISTTPIKKKRFIKPEAINSNPDLKDLVDLVNRSKTKDLQNDLVMLQLLLNSFQSNEFSDFLGIYFEDTKVVSGGVYEYRINKILNGKELLLGVSLPILLQKNFAAPAVDSVTVFQNGKKIAFNWSHDESRIYAVNIYRKNLSDLSEVKLNKLPLVLSKITDSLGRLRYPNPMFMEDKKLKEGDTYSYSFSGLGFFGNETEKSKPVVVTFKDVTPPPAPRELNAKPDSMKVHLRWENVPVDDFDGVFVYRSRKRDGPFVKINDEKLAFAVTQFTDSLNVQGPCYYFVSAIDRDGNEAHSNLSFADVQDVFPPAAPEGLQMKADTGIVHLSWKKGIEPDLAGYYLYRTVNSHDTKKYVLLNAIPLNENHFSERLPANIKNKFYYYLIATDTSFNRSKMSSFVSARMPDVVGPEKPFIKSVSCQDDVITVKWIPNVESDLKSYNLYRADSSLIFTKLNVNPLGRGTFRFVDRTHAPNTDYHYYLEAIDSAGNISIKSNQAYGKRVVKSRDETRTVSIQLKSKIDKRKNQISLEWKLNDVDVIGYVLYKGTDASVLRPITGLIKEKKFTETADRGVDVFYQVRAYSKEKTFYSPPTKFKN